MEGVLFKACQNAAAFFQPADGTFDDISLTILVLVEVVLSRFVVSRGDHIFDAMGSAPVANSLGTIGFVTRHGLWIPGGRCGFGRCGFDLRRGFGIATRNRQRPGFHDGFKLRRFMVLPRR